MDVAFTEKPRDGAGTLPCAAAIPELIWISPNPACRPSVRRPGVYCRRGRNILPMVTLEFPRAPDLPVKFAKSPLWETVACARLIAGGRLTLRSARSRRRVRVDRELLLVPSVLGAPEVFAVLDSPWASSVYYPARGAAGIREAPGAASAWLETLAGRTRARVLECLRQPATTADVAARLRLAPASAFQHLQRLLRAGLIDRTRVGPRVFYGLSDRGRRLLALAAG